MIYGGLRTCFPVDVSALVSALIFGIYHKNIVQGLYAAVFGIILAYIFEKTQSIWGSTLMHMAFNLSSYLISGIGQWFGLSANPDCFYLVCDFLCTLHCGCGGKHLFAAPAAEPI